MHIPLSLLLGGLIMKKIDHLLFSLKDKIKYRYAIGFVVPDEEMITGKYGCCISLESANLNVTKEIYFLYDTRDEVFEKINEWLPPSIEKAVIFYGEEDLAD